MEPLSNMHTNITTADDILTALEKAIHDEVMAAYQYWVASYLVRGQGKYDAVDIFKEHISQELEHADLLAERIMELGGDLPRQVSDLISAGGTIYAIADRDSKSVSELIHQAEANAVAKYTRLAEMTKDKDPVTHKIIVQILQREQEHRYEISELLDSF